MEKKYLRKAFSSLFISIVSVWAGWETLPIQRVLSWPAGDALALRGTIACLAGGVARCATAKKTPLLIFQRFQKIYGSRSSGINLNTWSATIVHQMILLFFKSE